MFTYALKSFLVLTINGIVHPSRQNVPLAPIFFLEVYLTLHLTLYLTLYFRLFHTELSVFWKLFPKATDHSCTVNEWQLHIMNMIYVIIKNINWWKRETYLTSKTSVSFYGFMWIRKNRRIRKSLHNCERSIKRTR